MKRKSHRKKQKLEPCLPCSPRAKITILDVICSLDYSSVKLGKKFLLFSHYSGLKEEMFTRALEVLKRVTSAGS